MATSLFNSHQTFEPRRSVNILTMPVAYSIADGMFVGIVSYVVLKAGTGRLTQVSAIMWIFAVLLIVAKVLQALNL